MYNRKLTKIGEVAYDYYYNLYILDCYFENSLVPQKLFIHPMAFLPVSLTNVKMQEEKNFRVPGHYSLPKQEDSIPIHESHNEHILRDQQQKQEKWNEKPEKQEKSTFLPKRKIKKRIKLFIQNDQFQSKSDVSSSSSSNYRKRIKKSSSKPLGLRPIHKPKKFYQQQ